MKNLTLKINDFNYTYNSTLTIIQACAKNKIDIPRFCFHEKLSIAGNCRMCLVEDLKQLKPIASCAINIGAGMSLYTNTIKVKKARESVLEFLLANHPLDCPICDQGGECDLQDQSIIFGSDRGRFYEFKRSVEDKDCGPLVKTVMNRCIHCTRCVRFGLEIAGIPELGTTGRGLNTEIGFYIEKFLTSELSGNVIDLCPVGALTSKPFSFTSRSWELRSFNTIDVLDSYCGNIRVDIRGNKIMRILPRNDEFADWISDRIRFSYDGLHRQRFVTPMVKWREGVFIKLNWKQAMLTIKRVFNAAPIYKHLALTVYPGDFLDLETALVVKKLSSNLGVRTQFQDVDQLSIFLKKTFSGTCLLVDLNLRVQLPVLNANLRQAYLKSKTLIYVLGYYSNFNYFVKHLGTNQLVFSEIYEGVHWICNKLRLNASEIFVSERFGNLQLINFGIPLTVVSHNLSYYSSFAFNLSKSRLSRSVSYLVNYNDVFSGSLFNIYQGHHADKNTIFSDLIFACSTFVEKNVNYLSSTGLTKKSKKIFSNLENIRDDWKIANALSLVLGFSIGINNVFHLNVGINEYVMNCLRNYNVRFKTKFSLIFNYPFVSFYNFTYSNDIISRASKVMGLCRVAYEKKPLNFIKN
jgi:NADH-quinone oxidoreductase chain G